MPNRKNEVCSASSCGREIQPHESAVAITLFCQTVGMGKRRSSKSERLYLCPQCAVVAAMGKEPPRGQPLNVAAYRILRNLVATDPSVTGKAWEELNQSLVSGQLNEGEILPPLRTLKAAS